MIINTRFQYYQNIRKLHPDAYWSSKVQHQMHEDQKLMGDLFFDQLELPLMQEQLWLKAQKKVIPFSFEAK